MVWNLFPFKGDFSFGKSQEFQDAKSGLHRGKSPGWFDISPKISAQEVMHEQGLCPGQAANHQLPIAVAFWIIQIVSTEECLSLTQNLMQIPCCTSSVILNKMVPQYKCSPIGIYHSHWLIQWSHHCSCMRIPVHSPWLPGYIDVVQTALVILTMAGLLLDRTG